MNTRSSTRNLFPPLDNPKLTIRRRSRVDPTFLNDFEMVTDRNGDPPVPDLRTMEELCQPTLNGQGGPIAQIAIQAMNFGLKNDMIQQVQNSCQFHGLPGDDANKHLDKFFHVTQSIKVNGVTDDALCLYLFPHSLTHHATAWFDRLPRNSITTFEKMAKTFLGKYFPPSMVTKLRNEITNFRQRPDVSLFEAWEHYKLSIDRCPNHNMLPVIQIDTFYNGLTLRHRDTINATAGGTFMKRRLEECYDLIENMTAYHNDWDTSPPLAKPRTYMPRDPIKVTNMTSLTNSNLELKNMFCQFMKMNTASSSGSRTLPSNTITNPKEDLKVKRETDVTKDTVPPTNNESTKDVQPPVVQIETPIPNSEPVVALVAEPVVAPANDQKEKIFKIFKDLDFNISFADTLILMPKFGPTIKSLLTNKEKLYELVRTLLNEHCSAILLKKLPEKLGDPGKFLIPCDFSRMDECLSLPDLGASINLMPLSVWNKLSLPELSPTCMNSQTVRFLVRRIDSSCWQEVVIFNLDQTSRYSANYDAMSVNRIDLIDVACEEYSQEVLGFFVNNNPTPSTEPIVSNSSPTLTPFGDNDFLLEEIDAFLATDDEPISSKINDCYYDSEGDILLLEEFLNDDPSSPPLPPQELKVFEPTNEESSIDEPPVVELKDLPPHLEYAFLEGDDKLPAIIAKDLKDEEKTALIKVLKSHKQALAWQLSDIKGIALEFCTHKILMEDDFKPAVQHQGRVIPKIYEVIKKEVLKLLDAGLIYPISDSLWVSPVHCVPKKGGFTVVENEENELIPTRLVMSWRIKSSSGVFLARKPLIFSRLATMDPQGDIMARTTPPKRCLTLVFIRPQSIVMPTTWSNLVTLVNVREKFHNEMKCLEISSKFARFLTFGASISWGCSRLHEGTSIYSWSSITCRNGLKQKRSPPTTPELFENS
nr:reverse transcriptase domain-containing protein [Tanacetum cinerariifolium]